MKTIYTNLKSELTTQKEAFSKQGYTTYRTRMSCACKTCFNNRDGVLVLKNNILTHKLIRCKACAKTLQS